MNKENPAEIEFPSGHLTAPSEVLMRAAARVSPSLTMSTGASRRPRRYRPASAEMTSGAVSPCIFIVSTAAGEKRGREGRFLTKLTMRLPILSSLLTQPSLRSLPVVKFRSNCGELHAPFVWARFCSSCAPGKENERKEKQGRRKGNARSYCLLDCSSAAVPASSRGIATP